MAAKSLFIVVFYFMTSMTCSLNMLEECCSSETHADHSQKQNLPHEHHEEHDHEHSGKSSEKPNPKESKACCDKLVAPVISSFKLLQKGLWTSFQFLVKISSLDSIVKLSKFWIHETDPPYIRGRPLYQTLYSINAPPAYS